MKTAKYPFYSIAIIGTLLFLSFTLLPHALLASPQSAQEAEARKAADATFSAGNWTGAEKAYLAYSRRMPPPKDAGDALNKVAECRMRVGDTAGALRVDSQRAWVHQWGGIHCEAVDDRQFQDIR